MADRIERELVLDASPEAVWEAITGDWLADSVELDLRPGGDAMFRAADGSTKSGWVEEARAPERLAFWWAAGDEPATRVELRIDTVDHLTRLRVVETRPLDRLDLIGTPLPGDGGRTYGPALVAA